jgi:hypothetical protein
MSPKTSKKHQQFLREWLLAGAQYRCECKSSCCEHHEGGERCTESVIENVVFWPPNVQLTRSTPVLCRKCAEFRAKSQGRELYEFYLAK